jgi:insulin receptor
LVLEKVPKEWEVVRDNVVFIREMGNGSFGILYEGLLRNTVPKQPEVKCAVKMVIPRAIVKEHIELLEEENIVIK